MLLLSFLLWLGYKIWISNSYPSTLTYAENIVQKYLTMWKGCHRRDEYRWQMTIKALCVWISTLTHLPLFDARQCSGCKSGLTCLPSSLIFATFWRWAVDLTCFCRWWARRNFESQNSQPKLFEVKKAKNTRTLYVFHWNEKVVLGIMASCTLCNIIKPILRLF